MPFFNYSYTALLIKKNKIILSYIENSSTNKIIIHSYKEHNLENQIINGTIFNIIFFKDLIQNFIKINKIKSKDLIINLEDDNLIHKLFDKDLVVNEDLNSVNMKEYIVNFQEFTIQNTKLIYQVAIKSDQIFQYNLLILLLNLNLNYLTTSFISWYYFYKSNYINNLNQNEHFDMLGKKNYKIDEVKNLFKNLSIKKIEKQEIIGDIEKENLMTLIGSYYLFLSSKNIKQL